MNQVGSRVGVLILAMAAFSISSAAFGTNYSEYCSNIHNPAFFKARAYDPKNHLFGLNDGGLFDGGVCWWHSLFQRSSIYLTTFAPSKQKPDEKQAEDIIHAIASEKSVVEIPGYENINDFSRDHWPAIQETLNHWQEKDGFLKQMWLSDILKTWSVAPSELQRKMNSLYENVETTAEIAWVMIKMPSIGSHAWLVVDAAKTATGYELQVIDSNSPGDMTSAIYESGSENLKTAYGPAVLYLGRQGDFKKFASAQEHYCAGNLTQDKTDSLDGAEDLDNSLE